MEERNNITEQEEKELGILHQKSKLYSLSQEEWDRVVYLTNKKFIYEKQTNDK